MKKKIKIKTKIKKPNTSIILKSLKTANKMCLNNIQRLYYQQVNNKLKDKLILQNKYLNLTKKMQFSSSAISLFPPFYSPCKNFYVQFGNNVVYIKNAMMDLKNHSQILIEVQNKKEANENQRARQQRYNSLVKFSYDSQFVAIKNKHGQVFVYTISGQLLLKILHNQSGIQGFLWTPLTPQLLIFNSLSPLCTIYPIYSTTQLILKSPKLATQSGVSFSKGQNPGLFTVILQRHQNKDYLGVYFTSTWEMLNHIAVDTFDAQKIEFLDTGKVVVVDSVVQFKVLLVDVANGMWETYAPGDCVLGVSVTQTSNTGCFFALGTYSNTVHLMNAKTWKLIALLDIELDINAQKTIVYKEQKGKMNQIESGIIKVNKLPSILAQKALQKNKNGIPFNGVSIMQFSFDDSLLAIKLDNHPNCIFLYSIHSLTLQCLLIFSTSCSIDFSFIPLTKVLCIVSGSSQIVFLQDGKISYVQNSQMKDKGISRVRMGKNQAMLLGGKGNGYVMGIWDSNR